MNPESHHLLERFKGITLKSIDYQEFDKIIYVFTQNEGVKHLIVKGAKRPKSYAKVALYPLVHAEFLCQKKGRQLDLSVCREITAINQNLFLRKDIDKLQTACTLARAIQTTQFPNCPSPLLFKLFITYIDKIKTCINLTSLTASFLLKLLRHEGILTLSARCSQCEKSLKEVYFYESQPYCEKHTPPTAIYFSAEDINNMLILTNSRDLHEITHLNISGVFPEKIQQAWFPKKTSCSDKKSLIRY